MPDPEDLHHLTRQTYDRLAADYVKRNQAHGWWTDGNPLMSGFASHLAAGATVLDVGCGPGHDLVNLASPGFSPLGLDYSGGMLAQARQITSAPLIQADMRRIPLHTASVDGVWMCASLLHLPRETAPAALRESQRILKPGGVIFVSVKAGDGDVIRERFGEQTGPRLFTLYQMPELHIMLKSVGFSLLAEHTNDGQGDDEWLNILARKG